jgi:hypothetical protein
MVNHAFKLGLVPMYSTTERQAEVVVGSDGSGQAGHTFHHPTLRGL